MEVDLSLRRLTNRWGACIRVSEWIVLHCAFTDWAHELMLLDPGFPIHSSASFSYQSFSHFSFSFYRSTSFPLPIFDLPCSIQSLSLSLEYLCCYLQVRSRTNHLYPFPSFSWFYSSLPCSPFISFYSPPPLPPFFSHSHFVCKFGNSLRKNIIFVFFIWSIQCYIIVCDVSKKFYIRR